MKAIITGWPPCENRAGLYGKRGIHQQAVFKLWFRLRDPPHVAGIHGFAGITPGIQLNKLLSRLRTQDYGLRKFFIGNTMAENNHYLRDLIS